MKTVKTNKSKETTAFFPPVDRLLLTPYHTKDRNPPPAVGSDNSVIILKIGFCVFPARTLLTMALHSCSEEPRGNVPVLFGLGLLQREFGRVCIYYSCRLCSVCIPHSVGSVCIDIVKESVLLCSYLLQFRFCSDYTV